MSDTGSSLHTLIFHGLKEDWMEDNMETLDKKIMVLELNFRKVNQLIIHVDRRGFEGCSSKVRV